MSHDAFDMNLVRQAQREGRLEQMWWMLQGIAESGHIDLGLQALRFIQGMQPFDLAHSLTVFDRLSGLTSPDVRNALMNTMSRIATREPGARSPLFERLLEYSRGWDKVGERLNASGVTRISGLWLKFSLFEKIILRALSSSLGAGTPGPRTLRDIAGSLTIFEPLLPEIELRLKLDGFVETGLLTRDAEGRYQIADEGDRRHIEHFGDILYLIHEHRDQFVNMISFENYRGLLNALKRGKQLSMARWLEVFGLDTHVWKNREEFVGLLQDWRRTVDSDSVSKDVVRAADGVAGDIAGRIRFEVLQKGQTDDFLYFSGKKLGLRNPKLSQLTLLLPRRQQLDGAAIKRLDEWILRESFTQQIFVMLYPWVDRQRMREDAENSGHDIVVLEERHLFRLSFAADQDADFMKMVLEGCDLESLSPYESQAPVREMFYGREGLIKEILRSTKGYALVGTRRLGKTSLLFRLQDEIKKRPHAETVFLECGGVTDALTMAERLAVALKLNLPAQFALQDFERALRKHLSGGEHRMLYCFFDEIDDLVASGKESEPIWQIFKSLSFEGRMTVYVAGFSELFARFRDYESLFFNFLIFRRMSYLDRQSAVALVVNPIQELGLRFEDSETLVSAILEKTSTHPNIIQIFSDLLVKRMARRRRRTILASDVEETAREPEFEESIVRIMHSNLIRPVEKLLLLLVAYYNLRPISSAQVAELLADWQVQIPIGEIVGILDRLVLYAVFEEREGQYDFAHPYFATILQHRDVESMITYYCDEVTKELGSAKRTR
ncbi:MAG: hypothetical protein KIS92_16280 [Planctomycetota bacterium]|nr:hypothetical protein [Planctomycetota bacterium]